MTAHCSTARRGRPRPSPCCFPRASRLKDTGRWDSARIAEDPVDLCQLAMPVAELVREVEVAEAVRRRVRVARDEHRIRIVTIGVAARDDRGGDVELLGGA